MLGTSKSVWGFDPRSVPGCALWLDAADTNSLTLSGSNVTQWNDKSGNEKHATAGGTTPTYSSATRSIVFGGAGYFTNSSLSLPLSTRSVFIVCKQTSRAADFEGIMLLSSPSDGSIDYDSSTTIPYFASGSNVVVGDTAFSIYNRGTYVQNYRPYVLTPLGIYTDVFGSSSGTLYVNGTSNSTVADSSGLGTANGYILGARKFSGTTLSTFLNGTINEILVYNTALTTSQRQQIEGYLAHKWGLTPSLPVISPLSIPGCQLWLDAADSSTLVLSGSSVTTWRDKSGLNNNATPYSTSPQRSGNSILFSGANALKCGAFLTSTTFSVFIVNNFTSGYDRISFGCWKVPFGSSVIFQDGSIRVGVNNSATYNVDATTSTPSYTNTRIYGLTLSSSSTPGSSFTFNGSIDGSNVSISGTSSSGNATTCSEEVTIGGLIRGGEANYQLIGNVYEVIVFNSALTTSQRQQIEGYLARKWGISISATLPSPHPFKSFPPA